MTSTSSLKRGNTFSRSALGLALSLGVATGAFVAQPAFAAKKETSGPKIEFSPGFTKVAAELDKAITGARANAAVQAASQQARAATDPAAKAAAAAQVDTALGGGIKAKLDAATAAATTPGDKLKAGEMTQTYAGLINDQALQYKGLVMMLESGVMAPDMQGKVAWFAGVAAYQAHDYTAAAKYVQQAKDGGYTDPQLEAVLNDAYRRSNNPAAALANAEKDIAAAKAAGTKPSEASIRTALQARYEAKQLTPAVDLAFLLVRDYPSQSAWNASINVVRQLGSYQSQESLDLMRLMGRTGAYDNKTDRDYIEYIQAVDPRRFPGEAQKVIDAGAAAGVWRANDPFVTEARGIASSRLAADRASLPSLERDARAASANGTTVSAAGDAFLSYGEAAKAEALYTIALGKSGIDNERVLTRLGIAQVDQGKAAEAQATFAKVQGLRKPIAQLWSAYAAQKASGTPVAVAQ